MGRNHLWRVYRRIVHPKFFKIKQKSGLEGLFLGIHINKYFIHYNISGVQWQKTSVAFLGEKFRIRIGFLGEKFRITLKLFVREEAFLCFVALMCILAVDCWMLWLPADKQLEHLCTLSIKDYLVLILARNSAAEYPGSLNSERTLCWMKK